MGNAWPETTRRSLQEVIAGERVAATRRRAPTPPEAGFPRRFEVGEGPIMTVEEVAAWLAVHPSTIYRLLRGRGIPAFRVGGEWRFHARALLAWLEQSCIARP